jgi:hypothetical protein
MAGDALHSEDALMGRNVTNREGCRWHSLLGMESWWHPFTKRKVDGQGSCPVRGELSTREKSGKPGKGCAGPLSRFARRYEE